MKIKYNKIFNQIPQGTEMLPENIVTFYGFKIKKVVLGNQSL